MRIIGGEFRSRRLKTLPGPEVRPTPDRLRETLFDVLAARVLGAVFLDAYAGSGAVGIEALSRGAARAIFLEKHRTVGRLIQDNLASFGLQGKALVIGGSALASIATQQADIVFLDPPYDLAREYEESLGKLGKNPPALVIAQHSVRQSLQEAYEGLTRSRTIRQGDNVLSFYSPG